MLYLITTLLLEGGLFGALVPFVGAEEAAGRALVMLPPVLWTARLTAAIRQGRITRRFVRWGGPGVNSTFLRLTNPEVFVRREEPWNFRGYVFYESFLCLLAWAFFGGAVVFAPIAAALGGP